MKPSKMNSVEEALWRRVDARKQETTNLFLRVSDLEKTLIQIKCTLAKENACPEEEMPEVLKKTPKFVVNERGQRSGDFWSEEEETYVSDRVNSVIGDALEKVGEEIGRTAHAVRCRLRQNNYYIEI